MYRLLFISIILVFLVSCEKSVSFDLDEAAPKLVVEATIENNQPPVVILSRSLNYFSKITPDILASSFVRNAEVFVSNGILTHRLKEYAVPLAGGYTFYYYSNDTINPVGSFTGALNTEYSLRIVSEGKEYKATTRIPLITKQIDSLFWKQAPGSNDSNKIALMVKATDPPGYGDYIRYFTRRNSEPFYPAEHSVFDDQIIDGTTYEVEVERGQDRNLPHVDGHNFFDKGDTVTFKLCNIDKATFSFWRTMEFSYDNLGNPFGTPTKILGNISNNALGYFGGYAAQFRTIIIPR